MTRSIPARAGEPRQPPTEWTAGWVYPRACGGTAANATLPIPIPGLSPRVRGNHAAPVAGQRCPRSIPARAGEPVSKRTRSISARVYPRACGGTDDVSNPAVVVAGLSPRVRGNPPVADGCLDNIGSIPARAGEPRTGARPHDRTEVYPRACGGTPCARCACADTTGLSPRVRGNPNGTAPGQ